MPRGKERPRRRRPNKADASPVSSSTRDAARRASDKPTDSLVSATSADTRATAQHNSRAARAAHSPLSNRSGATRDKTSLDRAAPPGGRVVPARPAQTLYAIARRHASGMLDTLEMFGG
jgi:hypothetical protein